MNNVLLKKAALPTTNRRVLKQPIQVSDLISQTNVRGSDASSLLAEVPNDDEKEIQEELEA